MNIKKLITVIIVITLFSTSVIATSHEWNYQSSENITEPSTPTGVAYGDNGNVFVMDLGSDTVYEYNGTSYNYTGNDWVLSEISNPQDIHQANNGDWYVLDDLDDKVYVYDSNWNYKSTSYDILSEDGSMGGMYQNETGYWYLSGNGNDKIYIYDSSFSFIEVAKDVSSETTNPRDVHQGDRGYWFVNSGNNDEVIKYNPNWTVNTTYDYSTQSTNAPTFHQNPNTGDWLLMDLDNVEIDIFDGVLQVDKPEITGKVKSNSVSIENANVEIINTSTNTVVTSTKTDSNGSFSLNAENDTYKLKVSKETYKTYTDNITVSGDTDLGVIELTAKEYELEFHITDWLNYSASSEYRVYFNDEAITDNATVTVENTTLFTVDSTNNTVTATNNTSIFGRSNITASYTVDNQTLNVTKTITVSPLEPEYIDLLPPLYATFAIIGNVEIQYLLLAIVGGIGVSIAVNSFAGISSLELFIIIGWVAGWVSLGVVLSGLFAAILIMLNTQLGLYEGNTP